ncbi:hypothetical protein Tsp_01358 [Trichinella spiralis]|uniref:hypothetical protein n=1 Tax=Trichinella spiralis TaxID=6334 RepID=UPI0001EFD06C|nr:hypothetical protein Tsp_01358 [Trichinella spiralis]
MGKESTVSRLDDSDSNAAQNMNDEDEPAETSAPVCEDLRMACNLPPPGAISSSEGSCNDSQNLVRQLRRRFSRRNFCFFYVFSCFCADYTHDMIACICKKSNYKTSFLSIFNPNHGAADGGGWIRQAFATV